MIHVPGQFRAVFRDLLSVPSPGVEIYRSYGYVCQIAKDCNHFMAVVRNAAEQAERVANIIHRHYTDPRGIMQRAHGCVTVVDPVTFEDLRLPTFECLESLPPRTPVAVPEPLKPLCRRLFSKYGIEICIWMDPEGSPQCRGKGVHPICNAIYFGLPSGSKGGDMMRFIQDYMQRHHLFGLNHCITAGDHSYLPLSPKCLLVEREDVLDRSYN